MRSSLGFQFNYLWFVVHVVVQRRCELANKRVFLPDDCNTKQHMRHKIYSLDLEGTIFIIKKVSSKIFLNNCT